MIVNFIRNKFCMPKNNASECNGDCKYKNMNNIEIKVSLGGKNHNSYNYVQLRMNHNIDYYVLTAYHLSKDNLENDGELYIFKISKKDLINIIVDHGSYAHGTISKLGKITLESINTIKGNNCAEYSIRPKINDKCWKKLLRYRRSGLLFESKKN